MIIHDLIRIKTIHDESLLLLIYYLHDQTSRPSEMKNTAKSNKPSGNSLSGSAIAKTSSQHRSLSHITSKLLFLIISSQHR